MSKKNNFTPDTRLMFQDSWECWWCRMNTADVLHHIVGRGMQNGDVESSPLNACFICNHKCHLKHHGLLMTEELQRKMLKKTYDYLESYGYTLTDKDKGFIQKYKHLYPESISC